MDENFVRGKLKELIGRHCATQVRADEIGDDEALRGGPKLDLDSLGTLNLLLSIEDEFSLDLTSQSITREMFENVNTLTAFVLSTTRAE